LTLSDISADINTLTLQKISYLGIPLQDRSAPLKEKEKSQQTQHVTSLRLQQKQQQG